MATRVLVSHDPSAAEASHVSCPGLGGSRAPARWASVSPL